MVAVVPKGRSTWRDKVESIESPELLHQQLEEPTSTGSNGTVVGPWNERVSGSEIDLNSVYSTAYWGISDRASLKPLMLPEMVALTSRSP